MGSGQVFQHFRPQSGKIFPDPAGFEDIDVGSDDAPFDQRRQGFHAPQHGQASRPGHQDNWHIGEDRRNLPPAV